MSLTVFTDAVKSYEAAVRLDSDRVFEETLTVIDAVTKFCGKGGLAERGVRDKDIDHWYTRLAAALTLFITNANTTLTNAKLLQISKRKTAISYIFSASGYRGMQHLVTHCATVDASGKLALSASKGAVILAFTSLDDISEALLKLALAQPPKVLLPLFLGWLNQRAVLTATGEKNRTQLLTNGHLLQDADVEDVHIPFIVNAWMYSSYASTPAKHEIKKWFNLLLLRRMKRAGVEPVTPIRKIISRPRLLVIHERFTHAHAMFRSYGKIISELSSKFELFALTDETMIDATAEKIFERVVKLGSPRPSVAQITKIIEDLEPDVIFYPSLGMSHWTVMLAQLRLASIQVASLGHPATTHSDAIDYLYTAKMEGDLTKIFSETVLVGQTGGVYSAHPELKDLLVEPSPPSSRQVRVAINSKVMKLSHRLLDICLRLQAAATTEIQYVFFPGERGLYFDGLRAAIKRQLPTAKVMPYTNYRDFLAEIAKCDLSLAAFPFGNTNSTVDTSLLGLPTVAYFGDEPPAQSDQKVIRMAGLPESVLCKTDEEYYQTALKLINSESERRAALGTTTRDQVYENLFCGQYENEKTILRDIITLVYEHHERIRQSDKKVWTLQELAEF